MSTQLRNLQGLRGVACLLVVLLHLAVLEKLTPLIQAPVHCLAPFLYFGYAGVELFFVISGFVMVWVHFDQLGQPTRLPTFLRKRFWRIYPTYWACLLASILLGIWVYHVPFRLDAKSATKWFLLLPQRPLNHYLLQAWTLVYEIVFYAQFAVLFLVPRRWALPLLAGWFLASVYGSFALREAGHYTRFFLGPMFANFLLGCFAAYAICKGLKAAGTTCALLGALRVLSGRCPGLLRRGSVAPDYTIRFLLFGIPSALLVYGLTVREQRGGWVLPKWLRSVGDASFSLYLTHSLVFRAVRARRRP